jgi:phage shock protein A
MARLSVTVVAALCGLSVHLVAFCPKAPLPAPAVSLARRRTPVLNMNMFDRFKRVAEANINNVLGKMEDPEKVLAQAVEDLQKDLVTIRQSYAEVMATQKRMQRQKDQADELTEEWYERAQLALENDDDELAREALTRRQQQADASAGLADQITIQTDSLGKLYDSMTQLETKISEARAQKDQMIARARTAKTATKVNDMLSSVTGSTSMDAFERMKEKVEMLETQAEVSSQLQFGASTTDMESRFKELETGSAVDDELAKMKRQLTAGGDPDPPAPKSLPADPAVEDELAKLKAAADAAKNDDGTSD